VVFLLPQFNFAIQEEYYNKAALLRVFGQYTQWPEGTGMNDRSKQFIIGILGENPFGEILEKAFSSEEFKRIKEKNVEIRYIPKPQKIKIEGCHILFISKSMEGKLGQILDYTRGKPILTVGETKGFAQKGVLFNLYVDHDEIRFEINGDALRESHLVVASQLLSVARIIKMPLEGQE